MADWTNADAPLRLERAASHLALVTIDRPAARNAIDAAVASRLAAAVGALDADAEVRAVVLAGAGPDAFCAGGDLKTVARGEGSSLFVGTAGFAGFVDAPRSKPWIAAVEGVALAGGFEVALACDMIVAGEGATFGLPEVRRGLFAGAAGAYRLPRAVPRAIAMEMIATGDAIDAARAHAVGLVNAVVPAGTAVAAALRLACRIAEAAPIAVLESLALARRSHDLSEAELRVRSAEAGRRLAGTLDYAEGLRAFAEKRSARWVGG